MKDGNHFNTRRTNGEIHGIGESLEQATSDSRIDFRELERINLGTRQNVIDLIEKPNTQTSFLVLVPACRVADIKPGLRSKYENSHHPWDFLRSSLFRISSRTSSQGCPSEGLFS